MQLTRKEIDIIVEGLDLVKDNNWFSGGEVFLLQLSELRNKIVGCSTNVVTNNLINLTKQ